MNARVMTKHNMIVNKILDMAVLDELCDFVTPGASVPAAVPAGVKIGEGIWERKT